MLLYIKNHSPCETKPRIGLLGNSKSHFRGVYSGSYTGIMQLTICGPVMANQNLTNGANDFPLVYSFLGWIMLPLNFRNCTKTKGRKKGSPTDTQWHFHFSSWFESGKKLKKNHRSYLHVVPTRLVKIAHNKCFSPGCCEELKLQGKKNHTSNSI